MPTVNITSSDGTNLKIADIINDHKDTVQSLVKELMQEELQLEAGATEEVLFKKHEYSGSGPMLLLLDVSGSMWSNIEELKQYVKNLSEIGDIEWIAFDDKVAGTSKDKEVEDLTAGGGTNYIPAIKEAAEWLKEKDYKDIILLSDGYPFETIDEIINAAKELWQPLNTISIGSSAETVLTEIANETGGREITVDSIDDIDSKDKWDNAIFPKLQMIKEGTYPFGELMKYTQIEDCARLLKQFAISKIERTSLTIPKILAEYLNTHGFAEWIEFTKRQRNTTPNINASEIFSLASAKNTQKEMEELIERITRENKNLKIITSDGEPDMISTLMYLRPLTAISNLQWAATFGPKDTTITHREEIKVFMDGMDYVNCDNNKIELK